MPDPLSVSHRNNWRHTTFLFAVTSFVEALAFGHLGAFTPLFLQRELNVPPGAIPFWTGILSSLGFVIGLPLLPFWGVWADRFGRKLMIVRSSFVAALIYALSGASTSVGMLACARLLSGFVFGNTGIMMALQAEITPRERLGRTVALISAGSPIGMAVGPYLGGIVAHRASLRVLLYADAALTMLVVCALILFLHDEPHPAGAAESRPQGVFQAMASVAGTPRVLPLFLAVFVASYGTSMAQPYVPILIQRLYRGASPAEVIGAILSASGVAMAVGTPFWGMLGDRAGHLRVLQACTLGIGLALAGQAAARSVLQVAVWRGLQGFVQPGLGALSITLLALYTPTEKRAHVLNLSLLPQQLSWFLGPLTGARAAQISLALPFWIGASLLAGAWAVSWTLSEEPAALARNEQAGSGD
ncbi:MAG: MFS transporter [Chthonomonadales bacterium]